MSMVNGHLGRRVSDLLDGQLSPADTDAAWSHVHTCHTCRDEVEREGWVKTRLSSLSYGDSSSACAPDHLKGALLGMPPGDCFLSGGLGGGPGGGLGSGLESHDLANRGRTRRGIAGFAALGGGAAGAAVVGVLALGTAAPADIPVPDRRLHQQQPVSNPGLSPVNPRSPIRFDR